MPLHYPKISLSMCIQFSYRIDVVLNKACKAKEKISFLKLRNAKKCYKYISFITLYGFIIFWRNLINVSTDIFVALERLELIFNHYWSKTEWDCSYYNLYYSKVLHYFSALQCFYKQIVVQRLCAGAFFIGCYTLWFFFKSLLSTLSLLAVALSTIVAASYFGLSSSLVGLALSSALDVSI